MAVRAFWWWNLGLWSCFWWVVGLRGACALPFYQLFYTDITHKNSLSTSLQLQEHCTIALLLSVVSVAAFGAGAAAQRVLIQPLDYLQITPLCGAWGLFCSISLKSGLAGVSWKLKGSALGQSFLSFCYCSSKIQRSWWCPDCQRCAWKWWMSAISKASEIWHAEVAPLLFSWAQLHWTLAPGVDWYNWIILLAETVQLNASSPVIFYQGPFSSM